MSYELTPRATLRRAEFKSLGKSVFHPRFDGLAQFAQSSFEEMVSTFDHNQLLWFRNRSDQGFELRSWTELIARAADEQLRPRAFAQEVECVYARLFRVGGNGSNRNANSDERVNAIV